MKFKDLLKVLDKPKAPRWSFNSKRQKECNDKARRCMFNAGRFNIKNMKNVIEYICEEKKRGT